MRREPIEEGGVGPVPRMPSFTGRFADMAGGFYRLEWNEDGYPCRRQDDGSLWEHPIYPVYVLMNYLRQMKDSPSAELREAIRSVATTTVSRMEDFEGALVRWYEPGGGARLFERHYSALTQGYYAEQLWLAAEAVGDDALKEAARRSFLALTVPQEKGGVLYRDAHGVSIAEVPQQPNSYILNGWQSALHSAWQYFQRSGDDVARELVMSSAATMASLLPAYDAPEVANSRYGLTGFAYLRTSDTDLIDARLVVPGEGVFGLTGHRSRWANHRIDERRVNLVFSLASPGPNIVELEVARPAKVELHLGAYDPLSSAPVRTAWERIGTVTPAAGRLEIPREILKRIVYPTNFLKRIDGVNTNVYHPIHVRRLRQLAEITGEAAFHEWADRWAAAMSRWGTMPIYEGLASTVVVAGEAAVAPVSELSGRRLAGDEST